MKLNQLPRQSARTNKQQIQYMRLLQMSTEEFAAYVLAQAVDNPVIDMDKLQEAGFLERLDQFASRSQSMSESDNSQFRAERSEQQWGENLQSALLLQLAACRMSRTRERIARWLIASVDERGFLNEDPESVAELFHVEQAVVEEIMELLRSFSPPGVCARDMQDCLLRQAEALPDHDLLCAIIHAHLDDVAQGHWPHIAKVLSVPLHQVQQAIAVLRTLSPIPSAGYGNKESPIYVCPDIQIFPENGELQVRLCYSFSSHIHTNGYYLDLYQRSDDPALRRYLEEKLRAMRKLVHDTERRDSSILRCAKIISQEQRGFFSGSSTEPGPLSMGNVAKQLSLNVSTVSRTVKDKYVLCCHGVFPMKYFFSGGTDDTDVKSFSRAEVQTYVARLIAAEDPGAPLSDQQISNALAQEGIFVSRRSVGFSRESMGIRNSLARKQPKP